MFRLLHCREYQKTLYVTEQLHQSVSAWLVNYTTIIQDGNQVSWAEFREAFRGHHIPVSLMARKLQEFLHLQ
jgi:hypothetical protein